MSEVIGFRLGATNPREARAHEVLNTWIGQRYSSRFFLTKALIALDHPGSEPAMGQDGNDLGLVINKINQLLEVLRAGETNAVIRQATGREPPMLQENFLSSIK